MARLSANLFFDAVVAICVQYINTIDPGMQ
jgi:hypothetical protein